MILSASRFWRILLHPGRFAMSTRALYVKDCLFAIFYDRQDCLTLQVALKFEHRSSKGCNYGPPYEWQVYE